VSAKPTTPEKQILLLTGLSGSGKTFSLKKLEDMGYEVIDNPPIFAILDILDSSRKLPEKIAISIDTRTRDFEEKNVCKMIETLRAKPYFNLKVVFLDCEDDVLYHRYSESRRPHPLLDNVPIMEAIAKERILLSSIKKESDIILDTSRLKAPEFTKLLIHYFGDLKPFQTNIYLTSFGFRYGIPRNIEFLFDVRFLSNPYYQDLLKPLSGLNEPVRNYILQDPSYADFKNYLTKMFTILLPRYDQNLRKGISIGIGCTGGQHRSVFVTEELALFFKEKNMHVDVYHRDLANKND
jgi:UPF0042 nucleotide-binding protein